MVEERCREPSLCVFLSCDWSLVTRPILQHRGHRECVVWEVVCDLSGLCVSRVSVVGPWSACYTALADRVRYNIIGTGGLTSSVRHRKRGGRRDAFFSGFLPKRKAKRTTREETFSPKSRCGELERQVRNRPAPTGGRWSKGMLSKGMLGKGMPGKGTLEKRVCDRLFLCPKFLCLNPLVPIRLPHFPCRLPASNSSGRIFWTAGTDFDTKVF